MLAVFAVNLTFILVLIGIFFHLVLFVFLEVKSENDDLLS